MTQNVREDGGMGSEVRRPRGISSGKPAYLIVGLVVGSALGAGVYSAVAPRAPTGTSYCSVDQEVTLTGAGATFPYQLIDK